jgi:acetyltransferase-like isoleucine patch superfamily enzyme
MFTLKEGANTISCSIPKFPLKTGIYQIEIYIGTSTEVIDYYDKGLTIEIETFDSNYIKITPEQSQGSIIIKKFTDEDIVDLYNLATCLIMPSFYEGFGMPILEANLIGIYYFKDIAVLKNELQSVLDNNIIHGGEYQINDGIKQMMAKGMKFVPGQVDEWMDCGNKDVTVETNTRMLGFLHNDGEHLVDYDVKLENSTIIPPCYIGEDVVLINATVGPNVSLGKGCHVIDSTIKNSLIQTHAHIKNANLDNAMIGNHASFDGNFTSISIGDYSVLE